MLVWRDNLWESVTASEDRRMGVVSWVATFSVVEEVVGDSNQGAKGGLRAWWG